MSQAVDEVLTVEQFLRLPEIKPALEFVGGRVIQKVSPKTTHSVLQLMLSMRLFNYAQPRGIGRPFTELRCTFGGDSLNPDICYFARGRIPRDAHGKRVEEIRLAPDLIVEILSPGQTVKELSSKLIRSVKNGVKLAWLIQPRKGRVYVFHPDRRMETLNIGDALAGEDVLPGFRLPLDEMFGWLVEE